MTETKIQLTSGNYSLNFNFRKFFSNSHTSWRWILWVKSKAFSFPTSLTNCDSQVRFSGDEYCGVVLSTTVLWWRLLRSLNSFSPLGFPRRQNTARGRESMHECCVCATSANTECRVSMYSFLCRNLYFALLILSYIFLRDCTLKYVEFRRRRIHEIVFALRFFLRSFPNFDLH